MTTYNPNPTYPSSHPGNMTMYSNQVLSAGLHSEISSLHSLSPLNYVGMPPAGDRNEMLFMPPIDGQLDNLGSNLMTNPVSGDQNFECQGLSLSLGTHMTSADPSFSSSFMGMNVPPDSRWGKCEAMRNFGMNQYEPMGFANAIVKSKYLKAAQQLLDEVVNVRTAIKQRDSDKDHCSHRSDGRSSCVQSNVTESIANSSSEPSPAERRDLQNKKERLISMLDEVDRKYRQYCHQMQSLVSSFDTIAGPGSAKTYMTLALQAISRQFRTVRDAINGQIQATQKSLGEPDTSSSGGAIPRLRFVDHQLRQQKALQQLGVMRHAWRPQRGLPENSVSILRAWLFEHFLHPYPNDSEKIMLARQTGLTRNQVANWFINARVRLWKPMVEEMYKEEFGDLEVTSESSPENAPKATNNYNLAAPEDTGQNSLNNSTTPANNDAQPGQFHNMKSNCPPEIERESNKPIAKSLFQNGSHGECILHDHRLLYQNENFSPNMNVTSELNGFLSGNQVTLALGLQNRENNAFSLPSDETHMGGGNHRIASSGGNDTGDYHCMDLGNRQDRFSNSHPLHDFVV